MSYFTGDPLRIGTERQPLLDEGIVEDRFRLERILRPPQKFPHNPVVLLDRPWEGDSVARAHVIKEDGRYRMWYLCFSRSRYFGAEGAPYFICYAESDDGITWEKPALDVVDVPGFDKTNIVYEGTNYPRVQGVQVWRDEAANDDRRYRMLCVERRPDKDGNLRSGIQLAHSPDGLRWGLDESERPVLDYHSDCFNHVVRSPDDTHWLLFCRPILVHAGSPVNHGEPLPEGMTGRRHSGRRVSVATSEDLVHWSYPRTVLYPDERDAPDIDQCLVFRAGGSLVMLYGAMEGDDTGRACIKLATSPDGFHWHRFHTREPLIPLGPEGSWEAGSVLPSSTPIVEGERLRIWYRGNATGQHEAGASAGGIGLAETKIDRLAEQRAGDRPGYLLTREFLVEGDRLVVNTPGSAPPDGKAQLRVEVLRHPPAQEVAGHETVIPGFSLDDCDPITGDRTAVTVTWNGDPDLSALRGEAVYLRFGLRNKGLCAFQITDGS